MGGRTVVPNNRPIPKRGHKVSPKLVALSSSAILAVYASGYSQTRFVDEQRDLAGIVSLTATTVIAVSPVAHLPSATPPTLSAPSPYRDGTYAGTGQSHHGSIDVEVVILNGLIVSANITDCGTRYPCDRVASLPAQVIELQSLLHVTRVSGATDSTHAYVRAVDDALNKALL